MALYNYLGNSQANDDNLPFAAFDPHGMRFEFEQSDNAFTYTSVTNAGGKAKLIVGLTSPNWPLVGDRFTVSGTYKGVFRVIDTDDSTYVTIDTPYISTGTGAAIGLKDDWVWHVDVAETVLGTYTRVSSFKIRPRQDGKFTVDVTAFIQSVFGRIRLEDFDSGTLQWKGFHKFFKIVDQTGASVYDGLSLVFRACDWRFISSPIISENQDAVFFSDSESFYYTIGVINDSFLSYEPPDEQLKLQTSYNDDIATESTPIEYTPCSSLPAYQIAWVNRAGFVQSYTFTGTPIEKRDSDEEILAVDQNGVEYLTGTKPENYDVVEISSGKISSQQVETLWRVRDSIQAWDTNNSNIPASGSGSDFTPNWQPIIIERGSFTKIDHGINTHEIKFTFRYAQRLTMGRQ